MRPLFKIALVFAVAMQMLSCRTQFTQLPYCLIPTTYVPEIRQSNYDPVSNCLMVSWDSALCATQYQLEWTFAGLEDTSTLNPGWKPDFRFNSTRIITRVPHYNIPIVFEEGTLICRIRYVRINSVSNQTLFSGWSAVFNQGTSAGIGNLRSTASFKVNSALAHEGHKLNWQYSTGYSDEGWRKDEIQYLDGTLRQRQLVTMSNSEAIALATNTIYDNQGRPAISTIPAPVIFADSFTSYNQYGRHLGYFPKQALFASDTVYTYRQFDLDRFSVRSDSCSPTLIKPLPISIASGASRYFSSNNRDKVGLQGRLPEADGFPFTQTQWTDDNTNRVIRKSSPGNMHYIGSNHEMGFLYADVAQDEIDMLFGNDAGNESFYKKTISIDPNGQLSVKYAKLDGKVVATALAGPIPGNLDSIASQTVPINVDIVGTEQAVSADELTKFATKTFALSNNATCSFGYSLFPSGFGKDLCSNSKVCLDCRYKVRLQLMDQNGTMLRQVDTAIGTLLQNCATGNAPPYRNLFTQSLCKGSYTVTRTLTIDTSGFESYFQTYLNAADSCGDPSVSFPIPEKISSTCSLTCADCKALPQPLSPWMKDYCELICHNGFASPCDQSKAMMLINLSPGGQYAQYDKVNGNVDAGNYPLSILYNGKWRTVTSPAPPTLRPYIINNDLNGLVRDWRSEWAEYFLSLHPEYCYYQFCTVNEPAYILSKRFNDSLQAVPNAQNAVSSIYIDPVNIDPSLKAFNIFAVVKAKLDNFRNGKDIKAFIYNGFLGCQSIPPYHHNFANTPDIPANNMQWQMFRALYISIKNQTIDSLREVYVKTCGGFCNKCIGDTLNYYSACNPPGCNVPADPICNALKKKSKIFPSTFSYQEQLPFKLTGIDTLDLAIIQNYTSQHITKSCICEKNEEIESIFRYVLGKSKLTGTVAIPDTLCSVGIPYETLPGGYKGDLRWTGTVQAGGSLDVTLNDTSRRKQCSLRFISADSSIPWRRIIQYSCLRVDRIPTQFPGGANIFLVDLYDSVYKKYTAEVKISCADTSACKPEKTCTPTCSENGLSEVFNCGFSNSGGPTTINLQDTVVRNWLECVYGTKLTGGKLIRNGFWRGDQYIITLIVQAERAGSKKDRFVDSCRYIFDFDKGERYAGASIEVISIEPDRVHSKDSCTIYGIKVILKIQTEDRAPRYVTVYGRPSGNCFPIASCCEKAPPKKCPDVFSNKLDAGANFNRSYPDAVTTQLGIARVLWAREFSLNNSGYYNFSFTAKVMGTIVISRATLSSAILSQMIELWADDSSFTHSLSIRDMGNNEYLIRARLPFRYKKNHYLRVNLSINNAILRPITIRAYNFSLVGENCDDCCQPFFPPLPPPDTASCDSTRKTVDGHNEQIIGSQFLAELRARLKLEYITHCMSNVDSFELRYSDALYHFTLYYYDQADNLVMTVPPNGVHLLSPDDVKTVQKHRKNPANPAIYPTHTFKSGSQYNSLNHVTVSTSPDAGTTQHWYDPLGRLTIRQQARQASSGKYDYVLYDYLSRMVQSGEFVKPGADIPSLIRDSILFVNTLRSSERHNVTTTVYDQPYVDSINGLTSNYRKNKNYLSDTLNYLRHEVAATFLTDTIPAGSALIPGNYRHAIHYWYDMNGFVKMMIHEIPELLPYKQNLKAIGYDYELINGHVRKVSYQQGQPDQFYTRYKYDGDNILAQVETSLNDTIWKKDVRYYYSKHGMLARMEIGDDSLQGVDYTYTIQGWLKSVNSFLPLIPYDPGSDGGVTGIHQRFSKDAYGLEMGYFRNDYTPINAVSYHTTIYDSLYIPDGMYNGSIRYTIRRLDAPTVNNNILANIYSYDQLNRLTASNAHTIQFQQAILTTSPLPDYAMKIGYDGNGNILSLLRNGTAAGTSRLPMDALAYHYNPGNNQLQYITDTVNVSNYNNDLDGSQSGNYLYDLNGNLVKDKAGNIDTVLWNARGKINRVVKDSGKVQIDFAYDASGNRLSKSSSGKTTYYISDMNGNALATYLKDSTGLYGKTFTINGSKRLGVYNLDTSGQHTSFAGAYRQYELTDHLGNVLLTISDRRTANYSADVVSASDYYPFGMEMPGRVLNTGAYRYSYQGKEKSSGATGSGDYLDFGSRIYDARVGRFLSVDPQASDDPGQTPYSISRNNPTTYIDADGEAANWPPAHITLPLVYNHPIGSYALMSSNNTSPLEFYKWVRDNSFDGGAFNKFLGAFGEAEVYGRLMTDVAIGDGKIFVPIPRTFMGNYFNGEQVDIQSKFDMDPTSTVAIRNYSFNGKEKDLELKEGIMGTYTINYEVKTLTPNAEASTIFKSLEKGVEQTIDRSRGPNTAGVLVTDEDAWKKVANDATYGPKLKSLYNRMTAQGGYLRLEKDLTKDARTELFKAYDTVAQSIREEGEK